MPPLPPLLAERPPVVRFALTYVTPVLGGFAAGAMLGVGAAAWAIANVIAVLAGLGAGFEHDDLRDAARRGAVGGLLFGLAIVLADALVVGDRAATIADPPILQPLVTVVAGTLLALGGCALRGRAVRRAAVASAVVD
jgi:4-amino-4-deoxy-L-arabinose transferase-like glycosyltransferase